MKLIKKVSNAPWYKKLKLLRTLDDLSQEEAAKKCGTSKRIYWNWENGVSLPIKNNRKNIAKAFSVSEKELFSDVYKNND